MDEHEHLADLMSEVVGDQQDRLRAIIESTDDFCDTHLDAEYKFLCREMALACCKAGLPLGRGKLAGWAAGVVSAVGWVNFLGDPSFEPYMEDGRRGGSVRRIRGDYARPVETDPPRTSPVPARSSMDSTQSPGRQSAGLDGRD